MPAMHTAYAARAHAGFDGKVGRIPSELVAKPDRFRRRKPSFTAVAVAREHLARATVRWRRISSSTADGFERRDFGG